MSVPEVHPYGGPPVITLTDSAATKVKELIDEEGEAGLALRVAVRGGGCSGLKYDMFFDTDISNDDVTTSYGDVQVVVDPSSAQLLTGAELEYHDGADEVGFSITNPNNGGGHSCTCGKNGH